MTPKSPASPSARWQIAFSLLVLPLCALGIAAVVMGLAIIEDPKNAIQYPSTGVLEIAHALILARLPEPALICGGLAITLGIFFVALTALVWFRWNPSTLDQVTGAACFVPSLPLVIAALRYLHNVDFWWCLAVVPLAIGLLFLSRWLSRWLQARAFPAG